MLESAFSSHALLAGALVLLAALAATTVSLRRTAPRSERPARPRVVGGQFDLGEVIGEGGMGAVYKGWDRALKRPVAIKRLRDELQHSPRERERFVQEAELVARLRHPNIVEIHTIVREADDTFLVFEHIAGRTLHRELNASPGRHLSPRAALDFLGQVADAVDHAHARRVIHRDLKPANVMIAERGWAKVMDFGIARQVQDSLLATTKTIVGTPTYMAPEQALGTVARESDQYALAVTLYEMLTGAVPFRGPDEMRDKLEARFLRASALLPELPPAIDAVFARALKARPEERFSSCRELYAAASDALSERLTPTR